MELDKRESKSRNFFYWEAGERAQYDPRWIRDGSRNIHPQNIAPPVPDFRRFSPFGGAKWCGPNRER
jgi:hypothetical protein